MRNLSIRTMLFLSLGGFFAWGFVSWNWYTCRIKHAQPRCEVDTSDHRPLVFEWEDTDPIVRPEFDAFRDSALVQQLPDDKDLELEGLYFNAEKLPRRYNNMGEGRAEQLKKILQTVIPSDRIKISSKMIDEVAGAREKPFEAMNFNFIERSDVVITQTADGTVIQFPFGLAVKEVDPALDKYFEQVAERLKKTKETVSIVGHTDDKGSDAANLKLGQERADYVKDILIAKGIVVDRLIVESKGESEPIADNATEDGRDQNRRVVVKLIDPDAEATNNEAQNGEPVE